MSKQVWASWIAARIMAASFVQAHDQTASGVLHYLKNELQFDDHKGLSLSFRPNGQLRQPLLLVEDEKILNKSS